MPDPILTIIIALACVLVTAVITAIATTAYQKKVAASTVGTAEEKARAIINRCKLS